MRQQKFEYCGFFGTIIGGAVGVIIEKYFYNSSNSRSSGSSFSKPIAAGACAGLFIGAATVCALVQLIGANTQSLIINN